MNNKKTYCLGNYLIDLPYSTFVGTMTMRHGIDIESIQMTEKEYIKNMRDNMSRWKTLFVKNPRQPILHWPPRLNYDINNPRDERKITYVYEIFKSEESTPLYYIVADDWMNTTYNATDPGRRILAFKWDRGFQIKITRSSYDGRFIPSDSILNTEFDKKNTLQENKDSVLTLLNELQGRPDNEIPTIPGTCFPGGFHPGHYSNINNHATVDISIKSTQPLNIDAGALNLSFTQEDRHNGDTLEKRTQGYGIIKLLQELKRKEEYNSYSNSVKLNDFNGYEYLLFNKKSANIISKISFIFSANEGINDKLPTIDFKINNINGSDMRIGEDELIEYWSEIIQSLRLRKNSL